MDWSTPLPHLPAEESLPVSSGEVEFPFPAVKGKEQSEWCREPQL